MRKSFHKVRIGLFSIGLNQYWTQMPEMKNEITDYLSEIDRRLSIFGEVINMGIIDSVEAGRKAENTFISNDIDIIFIHVGTYGPSNAVLAAIRRCNVPIITLHLQPVEDFTNLEKSPSFTLPKNTFAASGELGAVLNSMGKKFRSIVGKLYGDDDVWAEIEKWIQAVYIKRALRECNIGFIGNHFSGMTDLYIDGLFLINAIGLNIELLEMSDLRRYIDCINDDDARMGYDLIKKIFIIDLKKIDKKDIYWVIKVALGLENMVSELKLNALTYHYSGYPGTYEERISHSLTLGSTLLTGKGIPCAVEGDIMVALSMYILSLYGGGATQAEHYYADYKKDINFISHSGPGDYLISNAKPILKWLDFFHGKKGGGAAIEFSIKEGPITLLSITPYNNRLKMIVGEGEAVNSPKPEGEITTKIKFKSGVKNFMTKWILEGPSHHSALGLNHNVNNLKKLAYILDIDLVIVD